MLYSSKFSVYPLPSIFSALFFKAFADLISFFLSDLEILALFILSLTKSFE
jgi:hypothetical protein